MTYYINTENTGLATDEQAAKVARILAAKGYDVEFTRGSGMVNPSESRPCTDAEWEDALIAADEADEFCASYHCPGDCGLKGHGYQHKGH